MIQSRCERGNILTFSDVFTYQNERFPASQEQHWKAIGVWGIVSFVIVSFFLRIRSYFYCISAKKHVTVCFFVLILVPACDIIIWNVTIRQRKGCIIAEPRFVCFMQIISIKQNGGQLEKLPSIFITVICKHARAC